MKIGNIHKNRMYNLQTVQFKFDWCKNAKVYYEKTAYQRNGCELSLLYNFEAQF